MPSLVFNGEHTGDFTVPFDDGLIVGSGEESSLMVEHRDISPCHAEISLNAEDGAWWVRDLESAAGTFVNGLRVRTGKLLHGDMIAFGSIVARLVHEEPAVEIMETLKRGDTEKVAAEHEEAKKCEREALQAAIAGLTKEKADVESALQERVAHLKKQESELRWAAGALKQTEERQAYLSKEVEAVQKVVRSHQDEQEALRTAITGLAKEKSDAESTLQERAAKLAEAAGALKQTEDRHAQLAAGVDRLTGVQETLIAGRVKLEEAIAGHQTEQGRLGALVAEFTEKHAAAEIAFNEAEQRRAQLVGEVEGLAASKAALDAALAERAANLQDHDRALAIATEDTRKQAEQRANLLTEVEALKVAIQLRQTEQEERQASIVALAIEKSGAESALQDCWTELKKHETDLKKERADLGSATAALKQTEEQHAQLLAEVEALKVAVRGHRIEQETAMAEKADALQKTEAQRAEAQRELDRLTSEQQKLAIAARRLEAAVEGRTVEEERLRGILRSHEARSAEITSGLKTQEAALRERQSAFALAGQALIQSKEQHALLLDEIGKFESQIHALKGERDRLGGQRASLLEENAQLGATIATQQEQNRELEKKRAEAFSAFTEQKAKLDAVTVELADLQTQHQKLRGDLEQATVTHKSMLAESQKHGADARAAQDEAARCRAESARLTALAESARQEIGSLSKTNAELAAQLRDLNSRVEATSERLKGLSGTEEKLLQARAEFEDVRQQYGRLSDEVARLGAERDATREHHLNLGEEIVRMQRDRSQVEGQIGDVQARHQETVRSFEQYHSEASHARRLLGAEIAKVEAQFSNAQSRHESVLGKVEEAQRRQAELAEENRRLEAAARDLSHVEEDIRISELIAKELEERRQTLENECAEAHGWLENHREGIDARTAEVKQLDDAKARLQKEVLALTDGEKHQRARFAELQSLNKDAEQVAHDQRAKHELSMGRLNQEVLALEARLTRGRAWIDELDKLYGDLASMPDNSPEAREYWDRIHHRKQEINTQLLSSRAAQK